MTAYRAKRTALITGGLTVQGLAIAKAVVAAGANVAAGSDVGEADGRMGAQPGQAAMVELPDRAAHPGDNRSFLY
jgi:3-hydroxybutyrate dehydrogenase